MQTLDFRVSDENPHNINTEIYDFNDVEEEETLIDSVYEEIKFETNDQERTHQSE